LALEVGCLRNVNVAPVICVAVDRAKVAAFLVVHRVVHRVVLLVILPLRTLLVGVNAVPTIPETVLLRATSAVTVVHQWAPKTLLHPDFKRF